jgi:hypothetical protein
MTDAASTPDPAGSEHGAARPVQRGPRPRDGQAPLSDEDLLALLDGLGVAGTHDPEDDQDAIAAAEWDALLAYHEACAGVGAQDGGRDSGRPDGARADAASAVWQDRNVSPVLMAEHLPTGPGLAAVLAQDPPAEASDWDLPGLAAGYRRLAAWAQARELAAAAEIAGRRAAANPRIGTSEDGQPASLPPEAAAEVALELRMSQYGASAWTALGCQLRWKLPAAGAALAAGQIDLGRARIIAEATAFLTNGHAAQVEDRVLPHAAGQTTGQLRAAVRRAVLAVDPEGAEQRRRDTERSAKISLYPGEEGTGTLTGSCLPGLQAAAAMARITAMARALKSAGAHGGIDLLRANVFLGLLLGTLPLIPPPEGAPPDNPPTSDGPQGPFDDGGNGGGPAGGLPDGSPAPDDSPAAEGGNSASAAGEGAADGRDPSVARDNPPDLPGWWPDIPPPGDVDAPPGDGDPPDPAPLASHLDDADDDWPQLPPPDWPPLPPQLPAPPGPPFSTDGGRQSQASVLARTGLLDVLIPWATLTGHSREPAIIGRIGPVTSPEAYHLLALATRGPATRWRVIITGDDGRALAVQHVRLPRHARASPAGANATGVIGRVTITIRASTLATPDAQPGPDSPLTIQQLAPAILRAATHAAADAHEHTRQDSADGACVHPMVSAAYRPPPRIREHVAARDRTCRFGPCGQPAWRTDLDHTLPWHKGGPTCPCNLGGCCRTHHKIKQLPGWHLEQHQPGTFRWTTPAGRSYLVQPDPYPV